MTLVFAVMHFFIFFIASVHSFFILFLKSGIYNSTKWSNIPACPSFMCFFNSGNTKGTNSSKKIVFDVCVFFMYICVRTDFVVFGEFVVDDLCAE